MPWQIKCKKEETTLELNRGYSSILFAVMMRVYLLRNSDEIQ
jgi:hypothetical protein